MAKYKVIWTEIVKETREVIVEAESKEDAEIQILDCTYNGVSDLVGIDEYNGEINIIECEEL